MTLQLHLTGMRPQLGITVDESVNKIHQRMITTLKNTSCLSATAIQFGVMYLNEQMIFVLMFANSVHLPALDLSASISQSYICQY